MSKSMGFPVLLVLALLAASTLARPQNQRDVKLITKARPGQEYVMIQSSVFQPRQFTGQPEREFVTSHKIPGKLPVDDPEDLVVKPTKTKIKRESSDADAPLPEDGVALLLTPDQTLALAPATKEKIEVRTEFSVVTSKPRKEAKERAIAAAAAKASLVSKVPSPTPQVSEPEVKVETKGNTGKLEGTLSGADEKKVMVKKLTTVDHVTKEATKVEQTLKEVEVKPASEAGVSAPNVEAEEGAITVPLQKKQGTSVSQDGSTPAPTLTTPTTTGEFEILPVNILPKTVEKNKEKDFDFVDTPLADKVLVPAGTNQQSRIEVKKGPNGQDYEYEYVYYYYDDDENDAAGGTGAKKTVVKGSTTTEGTTTSRQYLPKKETEVSHDKDADQSPRTRGRTRGQNSSAAPEEKADDKASAKTRYTSIERVTTPATDSANEIIPARGASSRTRGRTLTTEEPTVAVEERLPANTRFPPRSRSNHNSNSVSATTPIPVETSTTRGRGSSNANSVRRPSLELVDSSSFKTQSSDVSRDQDPRPEFPKTLPSANDEEESPKPRARGRGQSTTPATIDSEEEDEIRSSHSRGQLSRRPDATIRSRGQSEADDEEDEDVARVPESVTSLPEDGQSLTTIADENIGLTAVAMDKAALELYAALSQARAESNSIDEELAGEELTTELDDISTTLEPTTEAPTTTTTTTTTPAPTTTTTTTTEAPAATGRGRYRQKSNTRGSGTGNRFRGGDSTSTTTEAPVETSTKARGRFGTNRVTNGGTHGRRTGFSRSTTAKPDGDSSHEHESTKEESKSDTTAPATRPGGFPRNRFSAGRTSTRVTTPSTSDASSDDSHTAHSSSAPVKPVFADRFNLRRRGGLKPPSTAAPVSEDTKSEGSAEETNEPTGAVETSTAGGALRVPGRARLSVGSGPRPVRPGPRINIAPRGRLGAATTTTTVAPSTETEEVASEPASSPSQEEAQSEETQEAVTTPVPDALTRLRNRPRLRVSAVKPTQAPTAAPVRRPLIPRRKLGPATEAKESSETENQDSAGAEETPSSSEDASESNGEESSSPAAAEPEQPQGLASLVSGRRRGNALRRPRTLLLGGSRPTSQA